MLTDISRISP